MGVVIQLLESPRWGNPLAVNQCALLNATCFATQEGMHVRVSPTCCHFSLLPNARGCPKGSILLPWDRNPGRGKASVEIRSPQSYLHWIPTRFPHHFNKGWPIKYLSAAWKNKLAEPLTHHIKKLIIPPGTCGKAHKLRASSNVIRQTEE